MTPQLTDEQRQALAAVDDRGPVKVVDPATSREYVLLKHRRCSTAAGCCSTRMILTSAKPMRLKTSPPKRLGMTRPTRSMTTTTSTAAIHESWRGDIALITMPFVQGFGSKARLGVVVQNDQFNARSTDTDRGGDHSKRAAGSSSDSVSGRSRGRSGQGSGLLGISAVRCESLFTAEQSLIHRKIGRMPGIPVDEDQRLPKDGAGTRLTVITGVEGPANRWFRRTIALLSDLAFKLQKDAHKWSTSS